MIIKIHKITALLLMVSFGCSGDSVTGPGGQQECFVTSGGVKIHFILDLPEGEGPFPAVVFGQGSGNITANNRITVAHTKKLLELGFAVMRYDKRGTGESGGELSGLSTANSTVLIPQLADDMKAVLLQLLQMPEIDKDRVGLFGASQANWYMPLVADEVPEIQFMVVLTGGVIPVGPKNFWEELVFVRGLDSDSALVLFQQYSGDIGFDQRPHIRSLDIPMLYFLGEQDPGIPFTVMRDEIALLKAEGKDITLISYSDGVHLLDGIDFWPDLAKWLSSELILN